MISAANACGGSKGAFEKIQRAIRKSAVEENLTHA